MDDVNELKKSVDAVSALIRELIEFMEARKVPTCIALESFRILMTSLFAYDCHEKGHDFKEEFNIYLKEVYEVGLKTEMEINESSK